MQQASGNAVFVQRNSSYAGLTHVLWDLKRSQHSVTNLAQSTDLTLRGGRGTHSLQLMEVQSLTDENATTCVVWCASQHFSGISCQAAAAR